MRLLIIITILILGLLQSSPKAEFTSYLTGSAGETVRSINNAASPLSGIYQLGAKGCWTSEYWDTGFLLETGIFNGYPTLGSVIEAKVHYQLFKKAARIGGGGGLSFQNYYRGNYRGQFDEIQHFENRVVPMIIGQILFFDKYFFEYQKDMDNEIFWKFRIGYRLFQ